MRYVFRKSEGYPILDEAKDIKNKLEGICEQEFKSPSEFNDELDKVRNIEMKKIYIPEKVSFPVNDTLEFSANKLPVYFNNKGMSPYGIYRIGELVRIE